MPKNGGAKFFDLIGVFIPRSNHRNSSFGGGAFMEKECQIFGFYCRTKGNQTKNMMSRGEWLKTKGDVINVGIDVRFIAKKKQNKTILSTTHSRLVQY